MGGASTRAFNVAKGLTLKGINVKVIAAFPHYPHGKVPEKYKKKALVFDSTEKIPILRVWIPSLPHNSILNRILLHLCFIITSLFPLFIIGKVDVIWAANPNLFSFFPALIYGILKQKPITRNVDDLWPEAFYKLNLVRPTFLRHVFDFVSWLSYSLSVAVTPISQAFKDAIIEKYKIDKTKFNVIKVGVDVTHIKPFNYAGKNGIFKVMYSGILGHGYDFEIIFNAAKILIHNKNIHFVIRGLGEREPEIRGMIKKFDLGNVTLSTNFVSKSQLTEILSSADVFLLPMRGSGTSSRGLPTKLFEYQAMAKPIICASRGEPAKYVADTRSGLVIEPKNARALADAILILFNNNEVASELGSNGWKYVHEHLTVDKIGEQMSEVLTRVTG